MSSIFCIPRRFWRRSRRLFNYTNRHYERDQKIPGYIDTIPLVHIHTIPIVQYILNKTLRNIVKNPWKFLDIFQTFSICFITFCYHFKTFSYIFQHFLSIIWDKLFDKYCCLWYYAGYLAIWHIRFYMVWGLGTGLVWTVGLRAIF